MNQNENSPKQNRFVADIYAIIALLVVVSVIGFSAYYFIFRRSETAEGQVKVTIDRIAIINKVQNLKRLETVRETIQRDVEIELDLGDFKIFDFKIAENKLKQKFAITGYVSAGIDLDKFQAQNLNVDNKNLTFNLPEPEILNVSILEDKTSLVKDDLTLLFKVQDLTNDTRRREVNEFLQKQAQKQGKQALVSAACDNQILDKAGENSKGAIRSLITNVNYDQLNVEVLKAQKCSFNEVS